MLWFRLDE